MRLLIVAGGTGGHIYPALAVARSLQARPDAPSLRWVGGHRGLEAQVIPATGIPFRRLLLRSLRSVDLDFHVILDPVRLSLSVPQAMAMLLMARPEAVFTTGGYVALPVLLAASVLRIPVVMWDGNVVPGRSVRATARLAGCLAVAFESTCRTLGRGRRPCFITGTPIRDPRLVSRADARKALGIAAKDKLVLIFGGSQAVRCFNSAVAEALPRLVERVRVIHVTGDAGYDQAVAGRAALPPEMRDRYRPERFLDEEMTLALAAADMVVGRAGSSTLAEVAAFGLPMVVVPYPHAAGHQRRNAEEMVRCGAARLVEDDDFDAEALLAAATIVENRKEHAAMAAAAHSLARPGAAEAVAELVLAAAERRAFPAAAHVEAVSRGVAEVARVAEAARGSGGVSRPAASVAATPAPAPAGVPAPGWLESAAELGRAAGVRSRRNEPLAGHTTMRVGGPADLLVVARDVPTFSAVVRGSRAGGIPFLVLGRGSDVVVADAGFRGLVVLSRAEGWRIDGDRLTAEAGLPLARAAIVTQRAGLSGLEFGLAIPGTVGGAVWANAGAHGADVAGVLESVTILRADGSEATEPAAALSLTYRDSRLKGPAGDFILTATFRLAPTGAAVMRARLDEIRRWRQEHQPLGLPSAGSVFRNPPGDSAGRLIDACGLRGARLGGAAISEKHANFIVNEGGATASDVRRLAERARAAVAARFGIDLAYEVQFVGDWSGWSQDAV